MNPSDKERPSDRGPRPRWARANHAPQELVEGLLESRIAGPVTSHDRRNVLWKIDRLVDGDPDSQFGLTRLGPISGTQVLALMAEETGFDPDPTLEEGPSAVDPWRVLSSLQAAGRRLSEAGRRGERALLATGHPAGLLLLYMAVGDLLEQTGAKLLRPLNGFDWRERGRHRQVRYFHGVAVLTDRGSPIHTHNSSAMERMLEEVRPDVVFADHGFAGAAIEAGIDTISIADVNDPAPIVAKWQGRTDLVIVMDDNVQPEDYWPCFQAIAAEIASP
jgi:hypothetical protein